MVWIVYPFPVHLLLIYNKYSVSTYKYQKDEEKEGGRGETDRKLKVSRVLCVIYIYTNICVKQWNNNKKRLLRLFQTNFNFLVFTPTNGTLFSGYRFKTQPLEGEIFFLKFCYKSEQLLQRLFSK